MLRIFLTFAEPHLAVSVAFAILGKINRLLLIYREMLTSEAERGVGNHVDEQATARPGANFRVAYPELIAVLTS